MKGGMRHFDTWKNRSKSGVEARNIVNKLLARASLWRPCRLDGPTGGELRCRRRRSSEFCHRFLTLSVFRDKKRRQEPMFSCRKLMFSGFCPPIGTNSGGRESGCSQSCCRMISGAYSYPFKQSAKLGKRLFCCSVR
jgi:hypothetical protein